MKAQERGSRAGRSDEGLYICMGEGFLSPL